MTLKIGWLHEAEHCLGTWLHEADDWHIPESGSCRDAKIHPRGASRGEPDFCWMERRNEFAYVRADAEAGLEQARERARWIEQAPGRIFLGRHREALEMAERLKRLSPGEALAIEFGDDANVTFRTVLMPGDTIKFGFASAEEQSSAKALVERTASALGCEVIVI